MPPAVTTTSHGCCFWHCDRSTLRGKHPQPTRTKHQQLVKHNTCLAHYCSAVTQARSTVPQPSSNTKTNKRNHTTPLQTQ